MADRRLGDVPGIDDIVPIAQTLPYEDVSVLEVNGAGEITGAEVGLGDLATSYYSDPFAIPLTDDEGGPASGGGASTGAPGASAPAPSYDGGSEPGIIIGDSGGTSTYAGGSVEGFDEEQLANAQVITETGRQLGASDRDIQIALMTAIVESGLRNLTYGDRDSVGLFQQRDAWGSFEDRTDPAKAAAMFFQGGAAGQEGLFDIADRDKRPMGEVAQDVQVSAYPDRYAEHEEEAGNILASLSSETFSGSVKGHDPYELTEIDGKTVDYLTAAALDAAKAEFGGDFSLMQGSHNEGGVAASGGTHDGGGVVDLSVPNGDWAGAVAALRKIGFAAWVRNVPGYGQAGSGAHIHAVLIGNKELSPEAQTQVQSYLNNDDGLAGSRADDGPREFVNNRFTWADAQDAVDDDPVVTDGDVIVGGEISDEVEARARTFLGVPHKWGGTDYTGVDAAGFIRHVYERAGVKVPQDASELAYAADPIDINEARPGDLIAWGSGSFGILAKGGLVLEANAPGTVVQLSNLPDAVDSWAVPLRSLVAGNTPAQATAAATPYQPPAITQPSVGLNHGGSTDVAPHVGMNSGGSSKPPKPTTTKQPMDELY